MKKIKEINLKQNKNYEKEKITNISILESDFLNENKKNASNFIKNIQNKIIDVILCQENIKKDKLKKVLKTD
jgi:hypothetical protein